MFMADREHTFLPGIILRRRRYIVLYYSDVSHLEQALPLNPPHTYFRWDTIGHYLRSFAQVGELFGLFQKEDRNSSRLAMKSTALVE